MRWVLDEEVPRAVLLRGIDQAFARKREEPASLRACKRWINAEIRSWGERKAADPGGAASDAVGASADESTSETACPSFQNRADPNARAASLERWFRERAASSHEPRLRALWLELAAETAALAGTAWESAWEEALEELLCLSLTQSLTGEEAQALDAASHAEEGAWSQMSPRARRAARLSFQKRWLEVHFHQNLSWPAPSTSP